LGRCHTATKIDGKKITVKDDNGKEIAVAIKVRDKIGIKSGKVTKLTAGSY